MDTANLQKWCCIPISIGVHLLCDKINKYATVYSISSYAKKTAQGLIEKDIFLFVVTDVLCKN